MEICLDIMTRRLLIRFKYTEKERQSSAAEGTTLEGRRCVQHRQRHTGSLLGKHYLVKLRKPPIWQRLVRINRASL